MRRETSEHAMFTFLLLLQFSAHCNSLPLSTSARWIVDESTGERVKLTCVNWVSHLPTMIAEGLEKRPINAIAKAISANGFNCVRFTWATFMFTRQNYSSLTVSQSLDLHNLAGAKHGIAKNNPRFLHMKVVDLHVAVVKALRKNNLMVVLDNHVSKPEWCCRSNDGNGFFGDLEFDPAEWVRGLAAVARIYRSNSAVVGMSLRNELHGPGQNIPDWYKYMHRGATAIHNENPNLLVIISGLSSDTLLGFLRRRPLELNLNNKLVYEGHWYTFGLPEKNWTDQTNLCCLKVTNAAWANYLFLTTGKPAFPIFLSEFGLDQRGGNEGQNRYITCFLAEMAARDFDWALWAFQGSYMVRNSVPDMDEAYGVMNHYWTGPRNPGFLYRLQIMQHMNLDPESNSVAYHKIFHPQSGQCVVIENNGAALGNCTVASRWDWHHEGDPLKLQGSLGCLTVVGDGRSAGVSRDCSTEWKYVSSLGIQLGARHGRKFLCLEKNALDSRVVMKSCLCVDKKLGDLPKCGQNPQVQWFKLVPGNV